MENITRIIWGKRLADYPAWKRIPVKFARIILLTGRCFMKNKCLLRASALTYFTLLSIVPVAALIFSISKGFGIEERLAEWLHKTFAENPTISMKLVEYSNNMLEGAKSSVIAGIGTVMLLYTTARLMMQIETSFNDIWGVRKGRSFMRKFSDYLSLLLFCPIFIAVACSMTNFAVTKMTELFEAMPFLSGQPVFKEVFLHSIRIVPFLLTWFVLTFIYVIVPNTKVRLIPALTGGLFAGAAYAFLQSFYFTAQFMTAKYNAIYGGFAALPLFLIWMQLSWTLILFGTELSYAVQNVFLYDGAGAETSHGPLRTAVYALRIMRASVLQFESCGEPLSDVQIADRLELPLTSVREVIQELADARLLSLVNTAKKDGIFCQPAIPPAKITVCKVLQSLQEVDRDYLLPEDCDAARDYLQGLWKSAEKLPENVPLAKLFF